MDKTNRDDTIFNLARITVRPEHRTELCQAISSLIDPVESEEGCLMYRFYEEAGDENTLVVIGEWETPDAWSNHLKSDNFAVLLGSISLLCDSPDIDFKLLSHVAGIEAMTRARIECHSNEIPAT
jgi:quinol monooxygenase YgiN